MYKKKIDFDEWSRDGHAKKYINKILRDDTN